MVRIMSWTEAEITERFPVWDALSEFWLDGWLDANDYDRIAATLRASPYTVEQIWRICIYEVAPAVYVNLLSVAGEWGGFDPDMLRERIIKKTPDASISLHPGLWRRLRGYMHALHVKSSGWNQIISRL